MQLWLFLGGFAAVLVIVAIIAVQIRKAIRRIKYQFSGLGILRSFFSGLQKGELDFEIEESPRSLNACDTLLIPQILKDFPDFDPVQAKNLCKDFLKDRYRSKNAFTIYNVAFSRYLRSGIQKTIVMQAAASYSSGGKKKQIRCEVDYAYHMETADETVAANCPNCGGAIGYGVVVCPYCDSRVANVMGNTWKFQNLRES